MSFFYEHIMDLLSEIRTVKNFPKPGINFFDVTSILEKPLVFSYSLKQIEQVAISNNIDSIVAIDARGFIWAGAVANKLKCPLFLARKPGKLPGELVTNEYALEYGTASLSMIKSHNIKGNVLVIDDILATGGTLKAVGNLLNDHWDIKPSNQIHCVLIELGFLPGRKLLEEIGFNVKSITVAQ